MSFTNNFSCIVHKYDLILEIVFITCKIKIYICYLINLLTLCMQFLSRHELEAREIYCPHRIKPVRRLLELHGENLLAFAKDIDSELEQLSVNHGIDTYLVKQVFELQGMSTKTVTYCEKTTILHHKIGKCFYHLLKDIEQLIKSTVRASSIVENLNSRLRNYFFLRKTLGPNYLELLQFYINHRRYMRSSRPERRGKALRNYLHLKLIGIGLSAQGIRCSKNQRLQFLGNSSSSVLLRQSKEISCYPQQVI